MTTPEEVAKAREWFLNRYPEIWPDRGEEDGPKYDDITWYNAPLEEVEKELAAFGAHVTAEKDEEIERLKVRLENAYNALRRIAEGNLGDAAWQANYERIRHVARNALDGEKDDVRLTREAADEIARLRADKARLDALMNESWDLRCFSMPTAGGDDADIGWRVIGHYMAEPCERVMGEVYVDDPRAAIDAALGREKDDG